MNKIQALFCGLPPDSIIITPNNRLARTLQIEFGNFQNNRKIQTWATQTFIALTPWLTALWNQLLQQGIHIPEKILLTPAQSHALWQKIIHNKDHSTLLSATHIVPQVEKTWGLMHEWGIDIAALQATETPDQIAFYTWAAEYQEICDQQQWLDQAQLITYFLHHPLPKLPRLIYLIGFNKIDFAPAFKEFFELLKKQGHIVEFYSLEVEKNAAHTFACADVFNEMQAMASWAYQIYHTTQKSKILCVVPTLTECREELSDIFFETFQADQQLAGTLPFNIAGGIPLFQLPIIQCAFQLLKLVNNPIQFNTLSFLFNSPFFGFYHPENKDYALLELFLLKQEKSTFDLNYLIKITQELEYDDLARCLLTLSSIFLPKKATPSSWIHHFTELLNVFSWPGKIALTSQEYQAIQQWNELLNSYCDLDIILPALTFNSAITRLEELAKNNLFQAETIEASIHVVGLLEAAGMVTDNLWIMNMNNHIWPTRVGKNPFLPSALQKHLNMPHSSAQRELDYCQALMQQLLHAADQVICSYSEKNGDEIFSPSSLINHLPPLPAEIKIEFNSPDFIPLEKINDTHGPLFSINDKVKGGSDILKQQALCPFRAFALYRLHAKLPDSHQPGLKAKNKGTLLHECLERIWQKLHSQEKLLKLSAAELSSLTQQCIDQSCESLIDDYSTALLTIEKNRLLKIILAWLEFEKDRPAFQVIGCEEKCSVTLGGLKLNLKIDRIDQLQQGHYILIDYKTVAPAASPLSIWLDARPEEPQLPLYATTYSQPISGIAFANLSGKNHYFKGLTAEKNQLPGCYPAPMPWQTVLTLWQDNLTNLAEEFTQGYALIKPKKGEQTCRQCQLQPLCRIQS